MALAVLVLSPVTPLAAQPAILFSYADRYSFFNAHEPGGIAMPGVSFAEVPLGSVLSNQYAHLGLHFLGGHDVTKEVDTEDDDDFVLTGGDAVTLQFIPPIGSLGLDFAGGLQAQLFLGATFLGVSEPFEGIFGGIIREDGRFDRVVLSNPSGTNVQIHNLYFYPTPQLNIRNLAGPAVQLSWSTNASRYVLQSNDQLARTGWRAVTNAPVVAGNQMVVTVEATAAQRYFRLQGH